MSVEEVTCMNMKRKYERVYQFRVVLDGIEPPIWRRIQVPETYSFWDLHVAIQDSMGWSDSHLHEFRLKNPATGETDVIGVPGDQFEGDPEVHAGWKKKAADYFPAVGSTARYLYDFGDNWEHTLELEKIVPREKGVRYPLCVDGKRACPPEDCGGLEGYQDFLEKVLVLGHEDRRETLDWAGGSFDMEKFDPKEIRFDNPQRRWKTAFQSE
jgi:hypothetical protein